MGFFVGSTGVWVRVDILLPSTNPYPSHGFHGFVGQHCLNHMITSLVIVITTWVHCMLSLD
jgi:hypothetical protein